MKPALAFALLLSISCSSASHVRNVSCGEPERIPQTTLLFFGEMHGSVEAPEFVGRVACSYAMKEPTAVGLEIPVSEQTAINSYMNSNGDLAAKEQLLSNPFWQSNIDGRSSMAMAELIEYLRNLKSQALPITVFAFDDPDSPDKSRDEQLAESIREFHTINPGWRIVALMGNIHASLSPMQFGGRKVITTGTILNDLDPESVLLSYRSGTIWACMPTCGVHEVGSDWGAGRETGLTQDSPMAGYAYAYILPSITASPPAVSAEQ